MVDWNSDGEPDIVSGDRNGGFSVFIRHGSQLTAYYQMRLLNDSVIDVGNNSQPAVIDWNGDGMKDLLLGTETGYIQFYPNMTSDTWPMFQDFTNVEAAGAPIFLNRVNPYVFDLDQDGVTDLICGANDGYVRFYRNIGTNAEPSLAAEETLKTVDGVPIQPAPPNYYGSRCGFGDWNDDSVPDFLISGYEGKVELYSGVPTVGVQEESELPATGRNRAPTMVRRSLTVSGQGELLDIAGKRCFRLEPGTNELSGLPAGVYLLRMDESRRAVRRVLLLR